MQSSSNQWLKIDLHMHSYHSLCDRNGRVKQQLAGEFVDVLLNKQIKVFSITDHNCFNAQYYKEVCDYISSTDPEKEIVALPGCELNVYVQPKGKYDPDKTFFHMGVYFEPNVDGDKLEKILDDLYKLDDNGKPTNRPSLSEIINDLYSLKTSFFIIPEGVKCRGIIKIYSHIPELEVDKITENAMQKVFGAHDNGPTKFDEKGADLWAFDYWKLTREFEKYEADEAMENEVVAKIKNPSFPVSQKAQKMYEDIVSYSADFAYFRFSDWHNGEPYDPEYANYIFGNLGEAFDSVVLALADPASRIIVQPFNEEEPKPSLSFIKSVEFCIDGKKHEIPFSPSLNAIIGQRASGKSLLMAILLRLIKKDDPKLKDYKELSKRITDISATLYSGVVIHEGGLSSTTYVGQDEIGRLFENPEKQRESLLMKYFPTLQDFVDVDFDALINVAKDLEPRNKNYKSFSSYLATKDVGRHYTFAEHESLLFHGAEAKYRSTDASFAELIDAVGGLGHNVYELEKLRKALRRAINDYKKKTELMNDVIVPSNLEIKGTNSEASANASKQAQIRTEYQEALKVIDQNFSSFLKVKKLEVLLAKYQPKLPEYDCAFKSGYLFASGYSIKNENNDLKDDLTEDIGGHFYAKDIKDLDIERCLEKYWNGEIATKAGFSFSSLDSKAIIDRCIDKDYLVYEVNDDSLSRAPCKKSKEELSELCKKGQLTDITNSSLGKKCAAYLRLILDTDSSILLLDQPEDNIDNVYIGSTLVPLIKRNKKTRQLIFVTHNPSIAVYGDAFNYVFAHQDGVDFEYENKFIESVDDREEIMKMLDGGRPSFFSRNEKYGNVVGARLYGQRKKTETH